MIYVGHPETLIVMLMATLLFVAVVLATLGLDGEFGFKGGPILRPAVDTVIALIAGVALAAPLLFPGLQLAAISVNLAQLRTSAVLAPDLRSPLFRLPRRSRYWQLSIWCELLLQRDSGLRGCNRHGSGCRRPSAGIANRSREVAAFTAVLIVGGIVAFVGPAANALGHLPALGEVNWLRALMPVCLVIAVLAGVGCDAVVRSESRPAVRIWLFASFGTAVLLLGVIWLVGRDGGLPAFATSVAEHARTTSFIWPAAGTLFGLVVAVALVLRPEWRTPGAAVLLCGETILLLVAGSILLSSSPNGYPPTRAVSTLQGIVGSSRVAVDTYEAGSCGFVSNQTPHPLWSVRARRERPHPSPRRTSRCGARRPTVHPVCLPMTSSVRT